MSKKENEKIKAFKKVVKDHFICKGRHDLPWRKTSNPYRIAVSELMLQQTQVSRVTEKYKTFLKQFPTVTALARAPRAQVLAAWSGLGYNRRAKFLHEIAGAIVARYRGAFPKTPEELEKLPGIGPYTARAIVAFAYNMPVVFIETNIRTAYIHHFFPGKPSVSDARLLPYITASLDTKNPRQWYGALMDYGSFLKQSGVRSHRRSTSYVKQAAFGGSLRQARGAIVKILVTGPQTKLSMYKKIPLPPERLERALEALTAEQLVVKKGRVYGLAH